MYKMECEETDPAEDHGQIGNQVVQYNIFHALVARVAPHVQLRGLVAPYVQLWPELHPMYNSGCIFNVLVASSCTPCANMAPSCILCVTMARVSPYV